MMTAEDRKERAELVRVGTVWTRIEPSGKRIDFYVDYFTGSPMGGRVAHGITERDTRLVAHVDVMIAHPERYEFLVDKLGELLEERAA